VTAEEFVREAAGHLIFRGEGSTNGAIALYRAVFREGPVRAADAFELLGIKLPTIVRELREESAEGEVIKFLSRIERTTTVGVGDNVTTLAPSSADLAQRLEHLEIESVLIPMRGSAGRTKYTLCVSSQVGCAMGCTFCETAQMGLVRSLSAAEIVGQWYVARHVVGASERGGQSEQANERTSERGESQKTEDDEALVRSFAGSLVRSPSNIVFMGMGEPLDNYDNVVQAIAVLKDHNAAHLAVSNITVSTVGRVDGLRKLAKHVEQPGWHRLGIAFSLNSPNDADRGQIMPITKKYSLRDVQDALVAWPRYAGNKICVEYVLIPTQNDSREHARQIADFIRPFGLHKSASGNESNGSVRAVLNLIPYNPRRNSPWPAPTEEHVEQFMTWLEEEGVFVKRRRTKGRQMMGACGQLGTEQIRRRKVVVTVEGK
jgi:23S rRNA (adenine2503-C2)-methyltransferase